MSERRYMKQRVAVGSRWRRRRDGSVWRVKQSHRKDGLALLVSEDDERERRYERFAVLRDKHEEVK